MKGAASLFPLALVLLLGGLTFWLSQTIRFEGARSSQRHDPDYIVEQLKLRRFDARGKLQHTVIARKMLHFPDNDVTEVESPHFIRHRPPVTEAFAQRATISKDGKRIDLFGKVRMVRQNTGKSPPTIFETDSIRLFPDDERAETRDAVTITQGSSTLRGRGLEVNNKTGQTVLHGRVSGTFQRKRK